MLTIVAKFQAKCTRHPGYNPATDGEGGITAACGVCTELLGAWRLYEAFLGGLAMREAHLIERGGRVKLGVPARHLRAEAAR